MRAIDLEHRARADRAHTERTARRPAQGRACRSGRSRESAARRASRTYAARERARARSDHGRACNDPRRRLAREEAQRRRHPSAPPDRSRAHARHARRRLHRAGRRRVHQGCERSGEGIVRAFAPPGCAGRPHEGSRAEANGAGVRAREPQRKSPARACRSEGGARKDARHERQARGAVGPFSDRACGRRRNRSRRWRDGKTCRGRARQAGTDRATEARRQAFGFHRAKPAPTARPKPAGKPSGFTAAPAKPSGPAATPAKPSGPAAAPAKRPPSDDFEP
jgi:hypothetical protein